MSNINIFAINCDSIACPDGALGAMNTIDQNCAGNINQSEINSLVLWHPTQGTDPTTNWPSSVVGDFSIDNTDATDADQKRIFGQGDLAAPDNLQVTTNDFNSVSLAKTYTLNFDIYDLGSDTYDYLRKIDCSKVKPKFLYTTVGGFMYGKEGGIQATAWNIAFILERGEGSIERCQITITFKARTAPDRISSPLP